MSRFNLTFWGEILPGQDPEKVRARFAKLLKIQDPERLEDFFSGETITLRRNIERKVAAEYYSKLRKLGVESALIKVDPEATPPPDPTPNPSESAESIESADDTRQTEWEQARRQAELEVIERSHLEAEAKKREERAEAGRQKIEKQRRALREEAKKQAEIEAARRRGEQEELLRREAETAARRKATREAQRKQNADLASKRRAQREAALEAMEKQLAEQRARSAERKDLLRAASAQREAEIKAYRKTEIEAASERRRRGETEFAGRREQAGMVRQKEQAELARRREEAERARREEETELALRREEAERVQREQEAELARLQEEAEQARSIQEAELARLNEEAERASRQQAEQDRLQIEAEQARRIQEAELARLHEEAEQARRAQAEKDRLQNEAEQARRSQEAELARLHEEAEQASRQQAEQDRLQVEAEQARRSQEAELARLNEEAERAGRAQAEHNRLQRESAVPVSIKTSGAKVKSTLDLPRREKTSSAPVTQRQPGAPNDYQLLPFRNTPEVRERAAIAGQKLRRSLGIATLVVAISLLLTGRYLSTTPQVPVSGPEQITATAGGRLVIQAGESLLLHDRSGVGDRVLTLSELGLSALPGPMRFDNEGRLLAVASTMEQPLRPQLTRCDLEAGACQSLETPATYSTAAMQVHPITGQLFLADNSTNALLKVNGDGSLAARSSLALAPRPIIQLDSGLLFMNSAEGPAVSVYRYEDQAFGAQLDEVLLLPPAALELGQTQVRDLLRAGDSWWVSMLNPQNQSSGLYLFDSQWAFQRQIPLPPSHALAELAPWGQKVLLFSRDTSRILRFSAGGNTEADLQSQLLDELIQQQSQRRALLGASWALAFSICLIAAVSALAFTCIQYLRNLVYRSRPTRGAEPLDEYGDRLLWVDPFPGRQQVLRRTALILGLLSLSAIIVCIGLSANVWQLLALLLALSGPAVGLVLFSRGNSGHAGRCENFLVLVDHRNIYHLASGARVQHRGPFLIIDDVVVFTGTSLLPVLAPEQVRKLLKPVAQAGVRVDRKTVLVKLLEAHHPLAQGVMAIALALLAAQVALLAGSF